jgi:hypothetical protein
VKADDPELVAALAAIADGPGDEGRRRVLGDLLLERGDPRGEFLLLQFLIAENQASGAIRQKADELWRSHRREWMAGAEKLISRVTLDRGFPVEATLEPSVTPAVLVAALGSPMLATLRKLRCSPQGEAIVEALASPRLRELREVILDHRAQFTSAAERGVAGRLTGLQLDFELTVEDCALLLGAPAFSRLASLSARATPVAAGSRWARIRAPAHLSSVAGMVERLSSHPTLQRVVLMGEAFGDHRRFLELAPLWPKLKFARLIIPGSFELAREAEGTVLTLQNMTIDDLVRLRPLVPPGTVRVLLMPKRATWDDGAPREKLLKAYAGLNPKTLP